MGAARKALAVTLTLCVLLCALAGCHPTQPTTGTAAPGLEVVDYAAQLKLNMSTSTLKQEATVKTYVDGDTVHFNVPASVMDGGVLKARFLTIIITTQTTAGNKANVITKLFV